MSRFFRSATSSGSSSSEDSDDDTEELASQSLEISRSNSQDVGNVSLDTLAIDRPRNALAAQSQDMLMHTLLERDARHHVYEQRRQAGKSLNDKDAITREIQDHYRRMVANLAPFNLVSHGLEEDRHAPLRRQIGDGLDRMASSAPTSSQAAVPLPIQRLLKDVTHNSLVNEPGSPAALLGNMSLGMPAPMQSRYIQDFEELDVLGKGGFGEVRCRWPH